VCRPIGHVLWEMYQENYLYRGGGTGQMERAGKGNSGLLGLCHAFCGNGNANHHLETLMIIK
jgi:hypothetical protein